MKSYQHVLFATNLNTDNQLVADKAKDLAHQSGAKLSIVHVVGYFPVLYGAGELALPLDGDVEESIRNQAQVTLAKEGTRLGVAPSDQWLEMGDTTEGLVGLVRKLGVDLLILGSHEHHGLGFLMGSTSNAMLHAMPCDVLAVRIK